MCGINRSFVPLLCLALAVGHAGVVSAAITAAFIDVDRTPLGAALEAELLAASEVQWIERNRLDLLVKEQRLQAAFEPEGVATRSELGKLLHADALVLLRRRTTVGLGRQPGYDLVVCQTQRGLRLATQVLIENSEQSLDTAKAAELVVRQLQKSAEPIREVFTVPPLIGRDPSYKFSHLQRGYAELLIARLLAQSGIAVVETAEARAVAAERLLAGDADGVVDYAAPIFVTGEFRHSGEGDAEQVRIQLTARRGETSVGAKFDETLDGTSVAAALSDWIDGIAAAGSNPSDAPPLDRDAEAKRLLERGRELFIWGNRDESWALAEAGLLYRPDDLALRRLAFDAVSEIFHGHISICRVRGEVWPPMRLAFFRTCEHLEFLARHDGPMSAKSGLPPYWSPSYFGTLRSVEQPPSAEARAILAELAPLESETLAKLYRIRLERGFEADAQAFLAQYHALLPLEKLQSEMVRHILEYPRDRDVQKAFEAIIWGRFHIMGKDVGVKLAVLKELKSHVERPDLVEIATRMEAATLRSQEMQARLQAEYADSAWPDLSPPDAPFREIKWNIRGTAPKGEGASESLEPVPLDRQPLWLIQSGPRLDLAVDNLGVYLVREPGVLDPIWETDLTEPISSQEEPCFDGRYIWMMTYGSKRGLAVVDPTTGKIWRGMKNFGLLDGLPADDPRARQQSWVMMTALRPGEVFAVITYGRTLLARIKFDPEATQPIAVTTLYECPENFGRLVDDWQNPKVSFKAAYLAALPGSSDHTQTPQQILVGRKGVDGRSGLLTMNSDGSQPRRSLTEIGATPPPRRTTNGLMNHHPLLVDLSSNLVQVVQEELMPADLSTRSTGVAVAGGRVFYTAGRRFESEVLKLMTYEIASGTTTVLDPDAPTGFVFFTGDETHVVGARWWKKNPGDQNFERVTENVPWTAVDLALPHGSQFDEPVVVKSSQKRYELERIYNSAHYGPVLLLRGANVEGRSRRHYLQLDVSGPMTGRL